MKQLIFDVCVIGCGPAGFSAAMRSYDFGNHVCIVEGNQIGGAGIIDGALTSKTMWELSSNYAVAKRTDRGYIASRLTVNYTKVRDTIFEAAMDKRYQIEDDDISDYVDKRLSTIGVNIHHQASLREVRNEKTYLDVVLDYKDGHTKVIVVDKILVSIGRVPTVKKLGLENIGIDINEKGTLNVDSNCKVSDNIYAVGDISGNVALVNIAEMEGRFAAKAIESKIGFPLRYRNISTIMFFNPEIATIGLNEKECQEQKIAYKVVFYKHSLISRAIAMRETDGFFKLIVTNEENPKVLGMRAAGLQAAASIMYIATVMDHKHNLKEILKTVHPHPSMTEGIQECLRTLVGKPILKPEAFPNHIKFKVWNP